MRSRSHRGRTGVRLAEGALLVGVLVLASVLAVQQDRREAWQELEAFAARGRAEWEARDFRRPALSGETVPGLAFERYGAAMELATGMIDWDDRSFYDALHGTAAEAVVEEWRRRWTPVLALLSEGAHREDARPPARFVPGSHGSPQRLMTLRWVVNAAVIESRVLREEGRSVESIQMLLDAVTLGADLSGSPHTFDKWLATTLLSIAFRQGLPDEALRELDPEALALLARALEQLDARLPLHVALGEHLLLLAHAILPVEGGDAARLYDSGYLPARPPVLAGAFGELAALARELDGQPHLAWPEREAQLLQIERRAPKRCASALRAGDGGAAAEHSWRVARAQLRLLRLAVDVHLGRAPRALSDPLGSGLIAQLPTEQGLRLECGSGEEKWGLARVLPRP